MYDFYRDDIYHKVAQLHCKYINQGFLATLGPSFLALLYKAIDKDKSSILIVKEVDGEVVGFVSGASSLRPIFMQLLFHPFDLIVSLKSCLISIPKLLKIVEILFLSQKNPILSDLPSHELLTIVVDSTHQGHGLAEDLFISLCNYFKTVNVTNFKIIVGIDLARAHAFYLKMGCIAADRIAVHKGKESIVYLKKCF